MLEEKAAWGWYVSRTHLVRFCQYNILAQIRVQDRNINRYSPFVVEGLPFVKWNIIATTAQTCVHRKWRLNGLEQFESLKLKIPAGGWFWSSTGFIEMREISQNHSTAKNAVSYLNNSASSTGKMIGLSKPAQESINWPPWYDWNNWKRIKLHSNKQTNKQTNKQANK